MKKNLSKLCIFVFSTIVFFSWTTLYAKEVLIGGAACETGMQAPLDTPGINGAKVAVKYLNDEKGGILGRPVKFVNLDGKSDPVTVGNSALEVIAQGAEFIGMSLCASDPLFSSWSLGDKQFTLSMWNTTMSATAAEFAYNEKGWKTAYVVTDQIIAYTRSLSEYFLVHFDAIGGKILLEDTYTNGDNDFSAQLARLKALDEEPDVIFISSYGIDIALITKTLREAGITAPILGGDSYDDPSVWEALGAKFGSDIYFVTHTWMGSAEGHPDMPEFVKLYTDYHGSAPDTAFVATGWDTVMLFAQAAEIAGTTDGAAVAKALEDNEFNLLTGDLDYSNAADGHYPYKAAALVGLTEGNPSFLGWRNPENPPAP